TGGFRYDNYEDFGSEWSPKVGAMFKVAEGHRMRMSFGHGFRAPRFGELYLDLGPFFKGNPDLQPVISDSFTTGYTFYNERVQASIDYFYTKLDNQVAFDFSGFPFSPITYTNIEGKSTNKGFNTEVAVNLPHGFTPSIAYTYTTRKDSDGDDIGGFPPPHAATLKFLWAYPPWGLRMNLRGNINGEEKDTGDTFTPGYQIWYLQASKQFVQWGDQPIRFYAQIDNLFNKKDIFRRSTETGDPIPGELQIWNADRTFLAGVTIDMEWFR
ncbi:TonB-dependent receptor plug domain-containing protein, partial [Acidobacteriota bacterium]